MSGEGRESLKRLLEGHNDASASGRAVLAAAEGEKMRFTSSTCLRMCGKWGCCGVGWCATHVRRWYVPERVGGWLIRQRHGRHPTRRQPWIDPWIPLAHQGGQRRRLGCRTSDGRGSVGNLLEFQKPRVCTSHEA